MVAGDSFAERFSAALTHAGIPLGRDRINTVKKMFGVSREAARKWLAGDAMPKLARIQEIAQQLNVSGEWLLTGIGNMQRNVAAIEPDARGSPDEEDPIARRQRKLDMWLQLSEGLTESQLNEAIQWAKDKEQANREVIEQLAARGKREGGSVRASEKDLDKTGNDG